MATRARAHRPHPARPFLLWPLLLGVGIGFDAALSTSQAQTIEASSNLQSTGTRVTDTTTTQPTSATTSNYVITGGLPTAGNALIHSFSNFGLEPGATATFDLTTGPSTTTAIFARIFSGSQSKLDGTISVLSLGNNVELALINPFGFLLGTGFNVNGISELTLLAAPQVYAQVSTGTTYVDLVGSGSNSSLATVFRLAGAGYPSLADLSQSSITYASASLAVKQLNLLASKITFTPTSVLQADVLRIVAPWFQGGINFGSSGAGLSGLVFGNYVSASASTYSFTQDDTLVATAGVADPTHFLLTRDSLYTASGTNAPDPGSIQFNGEIKPFSANTIEAFMVARQAYIALQPSASGFTSPFGDYATTDLTGTPFVSGNSGFSVIVKVDPSVGAYQAPTLSQAPTSTNGNSGILLSLDGDQQAANVMATLRVPLPQDDSFGSGERRDGDPRPVAPNGPSAQAGSSPGTEIAIASGSAGVGGFATSFPQASAIPALGGAAAAASVTVAPGVQGGSLTTQQSIDHFNTAELAIISNTAKSLGVADAEALTPAQLQKLLQAATLSMRKRNLQAQGTITPIFPGLRHDESVLLAAKPGFTVSDAGSLTGYFAAARYNPAILSIRYSEAKGRTASPNVDAFLDYTLIPADGPIIGHRMELASSHFSGLLKQLYGSLSRQEPLNVADRASASRQLHGLLIGPVADQLRHHKITTILIAADRGLQGVPFAALHDGQEFFGDRYAFSLTPALSLTDLKLQDDTTNRLLTFGASQFNDGLAPLPLVPQELEKISALRTSEALLNRSFTPKSLLGAASDPRYGWIHVATHAEFLPGGPSQSRLFTGTDPLPLSAFADLRKTRQERPIDLFTLSACRTALGDSESELGFAGLAIQAGARSAIGTLWYVDDVATSAYFIQVYRYLKQGLPKAEALQATRRDFSKGRVQLVGNKIIASDGELLLDNLSVPQQRRVATGLANPYFWAGIEMVGAPW